MVQDKLVKSCLSTSVSKMCSLVMFFIALRYDIYMYNIYIYMYNYVYVYIIEGNTIYIIMHIQTTHTHYTMQIKTTDLDSDLLT